MGRNDTATWTLVGIFIGMITAYLVNHNYYIFGAIGGGIIGYMLGKAVR